MKHYYYLFDTHEIATLKQLVYKYLQILRVYQRNTRRTPKKANPKQSQFLIQLNTRHVFKPIELPKLWNLSRYEHLRVPREGCRRVRDKIQIYASREYATFVTTNKKYRSVVSCAPWFMAIKQIMIYYLQYVTETLPKWKTYRRQ